MLVMAKLVVKAQFLPGAKYAKCHGDFYPTSLITKGLVLQWSTFTLS